MVVRKSIINADGSVDWQEFERLLMENPKRDYSDIFAPAELRAIYSTENTHDYYTHFGNVINRRRK